MSVSSSLSSFRRPQTCCCLLFLLLGLTAIIGCTGSRAGKKGEPVPKGRLIKDAISLYEMGRQLEDHGNYSAAIDKYEESLRVSPRPIAYFALGSLQGELLQFDQAKENLSKAIELSPGFQDARRELERVEAVEKLIERGEPIPESSRPKPIPPSLIPGDEERKAVGGQPEEPGEMEPGEEEHPVSPLPSEVPSEATAVPPSPPAVDSASGEASLPDLGAQVTAPSAEKLSDEEEAEVRAVLREAQILLEEGDSAEAIKLLQEALLDFPRQGRLHGRLGYAHQQAGNYRAALLAYEEAVRLGFSSPSLCNNLGVLYERAGKSHRALEAYRKAIEMGNLADPHYNLAVLLEKRGELEEALNEFEAYLALESKGEFADRARARVGRLRRRVR